MEINYLQENINNALCELFNQTFKRFLKFNLLYELYRTWKKPNQAVTLVTKTELMEILAMSRGGKFRSESLRSYKTEKKIQSMWELWKYVESYLVKELV